MLADAVVPALSFPTQVVQPSSTRVVAGAICTTSAFWAAPIGTDWDWGDLGPWGPCSAPVDWILGLDRCSTIVFWPGEGSRSVSFFRWLFDAF